MANYTSEDLDRVESILNKILDWAGVTDDTAGDLEVFAADEEVVTVDDVYDAIGVINTIKLDVK